MADQKADDTEYVAQEMTGQVMWLTLNRPQQRNPLSSDMIASIKGAIDSSSANPEVPADFRTTPLVGIGRNMHR